MGNLNGLEGLGLYRDGYPRPDAGAVTGDHCTPQGRVADTKLDGLALRNGAVRKPEEPYFEGLRQRGVPKPPQPAIFSASAPAPRLPAEVERFLENMFIGLLPHGNVVNGVRGLVANVGRVLDAPTDREAISHTLRALGNLAQTFGVPGMSTLTQVAGGVIDQSLAISLKRTLNKIQQLIAHRKDLPDKFVAQFREIDAHARIWFEGIGLHED